MNALRRFFSALRVLRLALRSAALRTYLQLAYSGVRIHPSVRFCKGVTVRVFDGGVLEIGAGTVVLDYAWLQVEGGRLQLGENSLIGRGAVVTCADAITLGDGTLTAEHVTIRDHDHSHEGEGRLELQGRTTAPITIGHDVWLAAKVTVTKGVEIADHAVVGANSVVTRSLTVRGVYVGAPARLLRRTGDAAVEPDAQSR